MGEKKIVEVDEFLQDIVPGFLENRKEDLLIMAKAAKDEDFNTLETKGHQIAGNAGGYGFDELGEIGAAIEKLAQAKTMDPIKQKIVLLKHYLDDIEVKYV